MRLSSVYPLIPYKVCESEVLVPIHTFWAESLAKLTDLLAIFFNFHFVIGTGSDTGGPIHHKIICEEVKQRVGKIKL